MQSFDSSDIHYLSFEDFNLDMQMLGFIGTNQALSLLVLCVVLGASDLLFFLDLPLDLPFMGGVSDPLSKSLREELLAELLIRDREPAPKTPSALSKRLRVLVLSHFLMTFSALVLLFSGFLQIHNIFFNFRAKNYLVHIGAKATFYAEIP